MKTLSLLATDFFPELDAQLVRRIELTARHVRVTEAGELPVLALKPAHKHFRDWRYAYFKWAKRLFPNSWVYTGGHHIAIHASPPPNAQAGWMTAAPGDKSGTAGQCLFRIIEINKLYKLSCGQHWGEGQYGRCWKCDSGFTAREIAQSRDANLLAAVQLPSALGL